MIFIQTLDWVIAAVWIWTALTGLRGVPSIQLLPRASGKHENLPLLSVIVAAKEEEHSIEKTITHLLKQSCAAYEIILVNDRSKDRTGIRMDEIKHWSEQRKDLHVPLSVVHITHLPEGWLGKNHALYQGYLQAKGSYLLFTDADIIFDKDTLNDAVHYVQTERVDHLTLTPSFFSRGFWLTAFIHYFMLSLWLMLRPWRANKEKNRRNGVGIGAFNLIRRESYELIGTHKAFALRPDDDLQLGKRVKRAGLRQRILSGTSHLQVEWYRSMGEAVRGLEKNLFSGFGYRVVFVLAAIFGQLLGFLYPFAAVWFSDGLSIVSNLLSIAAMMTIYMSIIRQMALSPKEPLHWQNYMELIALPISTALFVYVLIRSVWLALYRRGVYWRGTFYSLSDLKGKK